MVGGTATPTALKTLPQVPRHSVLRASAFPLSSIFTSCRALRSCLMSAHSKDCPASCRTPVQLLSQYQGQEAAEHMTSDVLILLMIHRPGLQDGFHIPEDLLHLPQFLVLECNLLH